MAKLSKKDAQLHQQAQALIDLDRDLTWSEIEFVYDHYHEGATNLNGVDGAFFTPEDLAHDFSILVPDGARVLDLCAGIGRLSFHLRNKVDAITCVEKNPAYYRAGKKLLPQANWVNASVFEPTITGCNWASFGPFDVVISNPPFGRIALNEAKNAGLEYGCFEYNLIKMASRWAPCGVFIVPQSSVPFVFSGVQCFKETNDPRALQFQNKTGIKLECNGIIDTSHARHQWKGVSPACEIITCDFEAINAAKAA